MIFTKIFKLFILHDMKIPWRILSLCVISLVLFLSPGCKKASTNGDAGVVYFLVSEINPVHGDSFILPLSDPADIAAAEKIVNDIHAAGSKIVLARIAPGSGDGKYLNKDLLSAVERVWSWHVVEFFDFVDNTIEIYDSWPGYVENNLALWLQETGGMIGFWSYTVTRKATISELQQQE